MRVFTIGTDHRKPYDFTRVLLKYGVQVVFDIRRTPETQEDYFRREGLHALVATQAIDYVFMGNELGGPRDPHYARATDTQCPPWTTTEEFRRGLDIIRNKAGKRACCLLCAERSPEYCHRRVIGEHLVRAGIEVVHILDENTIWHAPAGARPSHPTERGGPRGHRKPPTRD
jgi:uncharacterized protein (DUF488 family)